MKLIFIFILYSNLDSDPTVETTLETKINLKGLGTPRLNRYIIVHGINGTENPQKNFWSIDVVFWEVRE
jgi:hypothetical protein